MFLSIKDLSTHTDPRSAPTLALRANYDEKVEGSSNISAVSVRMIISGQYTILEQDATFDLTGPFFFTSQRA